MPSDIDPGRGSDPHNGRDDRDRHHAASEADRISLTDFFDAMDRAAFQRALAHRDSEDLSFEQG